VNRNRKLAGYVMLVAAFVMAVIAALFYTDVIGGAGAAREMLSLVLAAVAVADTAIGIVLIVKS
jgi:3-deoxy-D-manno-octulosonate 8-phosphate phosphatase KdsC-like HAD superfamily phosphatase